MLVCLFVHLCVRSCVCLVVVSVFARLRWLFAMFVVDCFCLVVYLFGRICVYLMVGRLLGGWVGWSGVALLLAHCSCCCCVFVLLLVCCLFR